MDNRLLEFFVSKTCNLRCEYCYEKDKHFPLKITSLLDISEAEKLINKFIQTLPPNIKKINVMFYGGEPMLNKDLIKYVLRNKDVLFHNYDVSFSMFTNFTIYDKMIFDTIPGVQISIDPPVLQNRRRITVYGSATWNIVRRNLVKLYKDFPHKKFSIRSVLLYPDDIYSVIPFIDLLSNLNINSYVLTYADFFYHYPYKVVAIYFAIRQLIPKFPLKLCQVFCWTCSENCPSSLMCSDHNDTPNYSYKSSIGFFNDVIGGHVSDIASMFTGYKSQKIIDKEQKVINIISKPYKKLTDKDIQFLYMNRDNFKLSKRILFKIYAILQKKGLELIENNPNLYLIISRVLKKI